MQHSNDDSLIKTVLKKKAASSFCPFAPGVLFRYRIARSTFF